MPTLIDPRPRVRLLAASTGAVGLILAATAFGRGATRFHSVTAVVNPVGFAAGRRVLAVGIGVALVYLAGNLARGKRLAWVAVTGLFGVHAVVATTHLLAGQGPDRLQVLAELAVSSVMFGLLVSARRQFPAKADPPSLFQFVRFVIAYATCVAVYGCVALTLERSHLTPQPTLVNELQTVFGEMTGMGGSLTSSHRWFADLFPDSLQLLGLVGFAVALFLAFRPVVARPRTRDDWEHARELVHRYGTDTLSFFALRHDKSYFFSSDGQAMVAYAYLGGYALVSGDPIGAPGSIDRVVDEFVQMCREHGWGYAFLAVREADQERYVRRGMRSFYLGDEAVIDASRFRLDGKRNKSMRQSVNRVARTYRFAVLDERDADPELITQLNALSGRWRGKAPERGFTMALSQAVGDDDPDYRLCVALDDEGKPGGFLRIVPVFGSERGYTLDMMRRDPEAPNGMTEFLVANTVFALRDEGVGQLSMNFAVMGRLFADDVPFNRRQRLARAFLTALSPFFQIRSLHEFNRRFRPEWRGRVIIYDEPHALPRVALLYGGVEGFLALPVIGRYFVPRRFDAPEVPARPAAEPAPASLPLWG